QRLGKQLGPDAVEQPVADPVRLHDAAVERVGDLVRAGDELDVRPGTGETAGQLAQTRPGDAEGGPFEELARRVRPAISQLVRREGEARDHQDAVMAHGPAPVRRRESIPPPISAPPAAPRNSPPSCGGVCCTIACSVAVPGTAAPSMAVTSTAGA